MNLRCHLIGHKHKTGSFASYDQLTRCVRCDRQLVFPVGDALLNTLEHRARNFRGEAESIESKGLEDAFNDKADVYEEAAEVLRSDDE